MKSAVVLAAGEGLRAWPFNGIRQKVTVPVANIPMVCRLVSDLRALGVGDIVVVVGHAAGAVRDCLWGIDGVRFATQRDRGGSVDAALAGLDLVEAETTLLACGDIATPRASLKTALDAYETRRAGALLLTAPRPEGLTASWTSVRVNPDGLVSDIWARGGTEHARFAGVAVAPTDLLKRYLLRNPGIMTNVHVGAMPPPEGDVAYSFDSMRRDGIEVHAVSVADYFVDVDKPWHILEANAKAARHALDALDKITLCEGASIDDGAHIPAGARLWLGPGAHIGKGCHVAGPAILGAGARVVNGAVLGDHVVVGARTRCEDYCKIGAGAVLGDDCVVGHCAEFVGVTFDTVYLYHYSCVSGLVGTHVDIGAATVCGSWRFDDADKVQNVRGHREIPECFGECTYIGDYSRTGVNAMFMPGVKVGYYACVGPGAIVRDDVPERTLLLPKQEHVLRPWGPERYGW